ncbi:MAG: dephospho-CoA kinase [Bacteroidales bacterium]|nr:dephospho-CoA kinase [Bacteroidales bacterium]
MKRIGITGGIGSGKTTVCEVFKALQIPVYHADDRARQLMDAPGPLREQLARTFGGDIYTPEGLDRRRFAAMLFGDEAAVQRVNRLVHPAVMADFANWADTQTAPYVLHEAAILFETGLYRQFDASILVTAPAEVRIQRVTSRDACEPEAVIQRMRHQWDDARKLPLADYVIQNDNVQLIVPQVMRIHAQLSGE